jgi:hypothetical protein
MTTQTEDLSHKLDRIVTRGASIEPCLILKAMLERGELNCRAADNRNAWDCFSDVSAPTLDRIAGIEDETPRACFELFVTGYIHFVADDLGHGLDIYWCLTQRALPMTV